MNQRMLSMLHYLAGERMEFDINELAEKYEVSQRTVRNDIHAINEMLYSHGLEHLIVKKGVVRKTEGFDAILEMLEVQDYYTYKLSKEERRVAAAILMTNASGYITLAAIADALFVSRATVIGDLDEIKTLFSENNLKVESHPNKGLLVVGKESAKRRLLFTLSAFGVSGKKNGEKVFAPVGVNAGDAVTIQKIVNEQEHLHGRFMTDSSFLKVRKYLGIMVDRIMRGEYAERQESYKGELLLFGQDILRLVAQYCDISLDENEVFLFCRILDSLRYTNRQHFETDDIRIQMVTRQFIANISEQMDMDLNRDYVFFENLSNHLYAMYHTATTGFQANTAIRDIAESQPEVCEAVEESLPILKDYENRHITDDEKMYIVVHVCAAMERQRNAAIVLRVIVACHAGVGTSQLLMERLKKHFNFHIVDIVTAHEAEMVDESKADFIISTIPIRHPKLDHVVVSPMLSDEDYIRVGSKIDSLRNSRHLPTRLETRQYSTKELMARIEPVIRRQIPQQAAELIRSVRREIRNYFRETQSMDNEVLAPYLHQLLPPSHIQMNVRCKDWREAIEQSALPLEKNGYIEHRYIEAMIANVEENGPYIVFSPGFAVPHEGLEMGSVKVGMNLIRLSEPVPFGAEEMDPVEFVCTLSAVDHKTHLKAFFNLVNMLCNTDFYRALQKATSPREMAAIIEKYEYGLEK